MKPFVFEGYDVRLVEPVDWERDEPCADLVVAFQDDCCVSHWAPTLIERIKLLFGGGVWLYVCNGGKGTQPPVALQVGFARKAERKTT